MKLLIKNGKIIDPGRHFYMIADILIENDIITKIEPNLMDEKAEIINVKDLYITPGLIDIHVHFRDPGFPDKETILTGTQAAAAGGFTSVVCMPNTSPAIHDKETLQYVLQKAETEGLIKVYSSAAITYGIKGKHITDMDDLFSHGAVTFTDDGRSVMDPHILYQAFQKAAQLGVPITSHCEDHYLVTEGAINRGKASRALGDAGIPAITEELIVARDILFAEDIGARLHIQHVTTARAVQLIREAKSRGVNVTAETAPHYFSLTDEAVIEKGSLAKVNPPLRTEKDMEAIIEGLQDGTLDAIATDHAPHTREEKNQSLQHAPFGLTGLETCVGLTFTKLVHTGKLTVEEAIAKLTINPARVMGLKEGQLKVGGKANITVIDPNLEWTVKENEFFSKSQNSPFIGHKLKGKAVLTIYKGNVVYRDSTFVMDKNTI